MNSLLKSTTMRTQVSLSKLLVIDDHKMIINGIKLLIGNQVNQFYEAHTKETAISLLDQFEPDLVIIDYVLQEITGDIIVREIKYRYPKTKILAYSFSFDQEAIVNMFYAG